MNQYNNMSNVSLNDIRTTIILIYLAIFCVYCTIKYVKPGGFYRISTMIFSVYFSYFTYFKYGSIALLLPIFLTSVLVVSFFSKLNIKARNLFTQNYSTSQAYPQPVTQSQVPVMLQNFHPNGIPIYLYHGTPSVTNAVSILNDGFWIIGKAQPPGIWLTLSRNYAESMAKSQYGNGAIILVMVSFNFKLTKVSNQNYRFDIPGAVCGDKFIVNGLSPIQIYDLNNNRIY